MSEARPRALAGLCALGIVAFGANASARHTAEEHVTADTAWTLEGKKNWNIGLFKAQVTLADRVSIGTYTWAWLARTPNAHLKWRFFSSGEWHFAAQAGLFRLDTSSFNPRQQNAPVFTVTTGELNHSFEFNSEHQLSHNLVATAVRVEGEVTADTLEGAGEAGLTNLQYVAAYEYRVSSTLALVVTGRYQLLSLLSAEIRSVVRPDEFTTIEFAADARDDTVVNFDYAFSVVPSLNWSWDTLNLRLGLGYGNFNVPGVNFMFESRTFVPEFDLFWTF